MSEATAPTLQELMVHADFVRAVARAAVRGDHEVDDVVQETWLASLEKGPRHGGSVRGWLATVARNVARGLGRGGDRRHRREQQVARSEALPSTAEIAGREETRRRLLEAVLRLAEPYRSAVLLRYSEDLPPRDVARRLDVPVETARTRIKRGVQKLREGLDAEYEGNRRAWMTALAPLGGIGIGTLTAGGALGIGFLLEGVAAAAVLGLVGWYVVSTNAREGATPRSHAQSDDRTAKEGPSLAGAPGARAVKGQSRIRGEVLLDGKGVPTAIETWRALEFDSLLRGAMFGVLRSALAAPGDRPILARARADADGHFELDGLNQGIYVVRAVPERGATTVSPALLLVEGAVGRVRIDVTPGRHDIAGRVRLASGRSFDGWVVLQTAAGAAGFATLLLPQGPSPQRCDEEGRFHFPAVREGKVSLLVIQPDVAMRRVAEVPVPHEGHIEIVLGSETVLAARVVDAVTDAPIADARLLQLQSGRPEGSLAARAVVTDAEGRANLEAADRFALIVTARGYAPLRYQARKADDEIVLRLDPAATISGRVLSRSDGRPVRGVEVFAMGLGRASREVPPPLPARSDAEGHYRIEGVAPGETMVFAHGGGWTTADLGEVKDERYNPFARQAGAGGELPLDLEVVPAACVTGCVAGAEGKPVVGATVIVRGEAWPSLRGPGMPVRPALAVSDEEGRFRIDTVLPGEGLSLVVQSATRGELVGEGFAVASGETHDAALAYTTALHLHVVIVDEAGEAIAAPRVQLWRVEGTRHRGLWTHDLLSRPAGTSGRAILGPLAPGRYRIEVEADGYCKVKSDDIDPSSTNPDTPLRLVMAPESSGADPVQASPGVPRERVPASAPTAAYRIHVVAHDGTPIGRLWHRTYERWPDHPPSYRGGGSSRGARFTASAYPGHTGELWLEVFAAADEHGRPLPLSAVLLAPHVFPQGGGDVQVTLPPGRTLSGTLLDEGGLPVPGVRVEASPRYPGLPPQTHDPHGRGRTDGEGRFELGGLGEFDYALTFGLPPKYAPLPDVVTRAGDDDVVVRVHAAAQAVVKVRDHERGLVAGADVRVERSVTQGGTPAWKAIVSAPTDAQGRARLAAIDPRLRGYRLHVIPPRGNTTSLPAIVADWVPGDTDVDLPRSWDVRGRVIDERGQAVPYARVYRLTDGRNGWTTHEADSEGRFSLGQLTEGDVTLMGVPRGHVTWHEGRRQTVRAGDTDLRLTAHAGARITLRLPEPLTDPRGPRVHVVNKANDASHSLHMAFDPAGRADVCGLEEGAEYALFVAHGEDAFYLPSVRPGGRQIDIVWSRGRQVRVRLDVPGGLPEHLSWDNATVMATGTGWRVHGQRVAGEPGVFELRGVPVPTCHIEATLQKYKVHRGAVPGDRRVERVGDAYEGSVEEAQGDDVVVPMNLATE